MEKRCLWIIALEGYLGHHTPTKEKLEQNVLASNRAKTWPGFDQAL